MRGEAAVGGIEARGRLPPLVVRVLTRKLSRAHRHARCVAGYARFGQPAAYRQLQQGRRRVSRIRSALIRHYRSHRNQTRPKLNFCLPAVEDPFTDFEDEDFEQRRAILRPIR